MPSEMHLHVFCDASPAAYGAAIYAVTARDERPMLLISKARVAPTKKTTLPRLELLRALVGTRLLTYVKSALNNIHIEHIMWTDSTIVLSWIRGDCTRWKQFVANRITKIKGRTEPSRWRYCPGLENGADKPFRSCWC